jgi:hypothetical protein
MHRALYTNNKINAKKKVSCRFFIGELFLLGNLSRKYFKLWNNHYKFKIELHNNFKSWMHNKMVHRIIFYSTKWKRHTHFRAQSCGFWVIFWFLLFDCNGLQKRSIVLNRISTIPSLMLIKPFCYILLCHQIYLLHSLCTL